ncbi:MAG: carbon-nitrogen hydrolase family protein [Alphaproteobacteria bacterium]|nr:carbon-nitrogen hydrolase family protein [Alphaproteobacteria bacterium]
MPLVACVQLNGSSDVERNLAATERLVRRAAAAGAVLVATPEATTYLGPHARKVALAEPVDGPTHRRLGALAAELGIHLLVGSVAERHPDPAVAQERAYNTSLLFDDRGTLVASYRKLHLFDVDLASAGGVTFAESERTVHGDGLVVAPTPLGPLGLSICFDLRFPELYAALHARGARLLAVPSAFTERTGRDHWHVLLRARAIETQSWVLAPGQWGPHDDQGLRRSYGHSLIVDPWGTVVAECGDGEGICLAEVDPEVVTEVRARIPMDGNRRLPPPGPERGGP